MPNIEQQLKDWKIKDYLYCIKEGTKDYLNVLKTPQGKINFFFSSCALAAILELV